MRRAILSLLLVMQACAAVAAKPARVNREAVPYTVRLPAVDRVELEAYEVAEISIKSVKATRVLEGAEARAFAALWRRQDYKPGSAACHYPFVGVKFYSRGRLLAHASVCWMCDNIAFMTPQLRARQSFAGNSRRGKELADAFARAFKQ